MCSSQNPILSQLSSKNQLSMIPDEIKPQNPNSIQINKCQNFLSLKISDRRAELIRSNKDLMKRNLKNSIKTKALMVSVNSKDETLTASSIKDLDSDSNLRFSRPSLKQRVSSFGSESIGSPSFSSIAEQSWEEKFDFIKKIGQGAHSTVYKSFCKVDNKIYAVKKIKNVSPQNVKKMKILFRMVKMLNHQNILKYHEFHFDEQKKTAFIVMDHCEFNDLKSEILKRQITGTKFSHKQILSIVKKVSSVLKYLHSEGICHRDIKPENILYDQQSGELKIIDLDVCGVKRSKNQRFDLWTNTGTLLYRAPESFQIGYSEKVDIWGLGTVLYELVTGKVPFESEYEKDFLQKVRSEEVDFDSVNCRSKAKHILKKCLQKDPSQRISASELLDFCENKITTNDFLFQSKIVQQKNFDDSYLGQMCLGAILKHSFY